MYLKYVGIRVTDLDRSLMFYTEFFGLHELRRRDMGKYGLGTWVLLGDRYSGEKIELNWYPPESPHATPYAPGEALDHIGFVVDDVTKTFDDLVARGVEPTDVTPQMTEGWTAFLKDPDGNWVEIFQTTQPEST